MNASRIILHGGDELEFDKETNDGVMTDAGLIPWDWITAYRCYSQVHNKWFTIPLDEHN